MSKIKKILKDKGITSDTKFHNYEYLYKVIQESMIEFGKLAFEAGGVTCSGRNYETYKDFLKEIEDE